VSPSTSSSALSALDRRLLFITAAATSLWCLASARILGATFDEPFYLDAGIDAWRRGDFRELLAAGTMPLPAYLQTLPLHAGEWLTGQPWPAGGDFGAALAVARSVTLLFWWMLLAYAMRLAHAIGGSWAGRLALLVIALDPNFLAHAALATTDVPFAGALAAFAYYYRAGRDDAHWFRRTGLPAAVFAVALTAKASAVSFGPLVVIALEAEAWWRGRRPAIANAIQVFAIGGVLAVIACGTGGQPSFQGTLAGMAADHPLRPVVMWLGGLPWSPNALSALWFQADHNNTGQPTFLLGYESARWLWFYVPVLPAIKLAIPTLVLLAAAMLAPQARTPIVIAASMLTVLLMLLVRVQTGIRFLLPLLALGLACAAARVALAVEQLPDRRRRVAVGLAAAMLVWLGVGTARTWPDGLRYTNEWWGGPAEGYRVVSDSNYDWGQGLPELSAWQRERRTDVAVWYFGTDPRYPELQRYDPRRDRWPEGERSVGYLAVSTSLMYGGYLTGEGPGRQLMLHLRSLTPVGRTRTFLIFDAAAIYDTGASGR